MKFAKLPFILLLLPLTGWSEGDPTVETLQLSDPFPLTDPKSQESSSVFTPFFSLGLPVPVSLGVQYSADPEFSAFMSAGYIPITITSNFSYNSGHLEVWGRWHPFLGAFFIGSMAGYQNLQVRTNLNLGSLSPEGVPIDTVISLNSFYLGIGLGWMWAISSKLYLGFDLGIQVPFFANGGVSVNSTSSAGQDLQKASTDAFSYFAYFPLPRINLLRVGWKF
jgi:hypothetical protein